MPRKRRVSKERGAKLASVLLDFDKRLRKCERALGFTKRPVGFEVTEAVGDRVLTDFEEDEIPAEVRRRKRA